MLEKNFELFWPYAKKNFFWGGGLPTYGWHSALNYKVIRKQSLQLVAQLIHKLAFLRDSAGF